MAGIRNPFDSIPEVDESKLVCRIGEQLVVAEGAVTEEGDKVEVGSVYEARSRSGYGWNLHLIQGKGAQELRILNSRIFAIFKRHQ